MKFTRPPLSLQVTTLWEYPSQQYGDGRQGSTAFAGATPSYILWNLLQRYTRPKDLVVDPMAGSGTTLAVAKKLGRKFLGFELSEKYAARVRDRLASIEVGQPLDGAPEPLVSAPNTENGFVLVDGKRKRFRFKKKEAPLLPGMEE